MKTLLYALLFCLLAASLAFSIAAPLTGECPPARKGKDYAVFFYVTKFQPGWQGLPDTKTEAEALKKELWGNYGFVEPKLVPNPTKQQIYDEIAAWNERLSPNDQVLFFFSMHGYYDPGSELGYLIAADGLYSDKYFKTWLDYNSLRPYFAQCKAKHVLVALDACYSGSFGNIERAPDYPAYDESQDCQAQIDKTFNYSVRQYICAGSREAKTPGKSLFAAKMLETLRRGNSDEDGIIHFDDLTYALGKVRNPEPVHGAFSGHAPGGEFIFVHKNACAQQPDRDGDNVPDAMDKCPDTWGSRADGCPQEVKSDNTALDLQAWKVAKAKNTEVAYRDYLRQFPNGEFKDAANAALRKLEVEATRQRDDIAWEVALEKNTLESYKKYVADYPAGLHRSEAEAKIKALEKPDNMVVVPGGTFQMGSAENDDEKPVHSVTVSDFYLGKYEVTVAEFKQFIDATGHLTDAEKEGTSRAYEDGKWVDKTGINWRHDPEGKTAQSNHPVINVSWNDAVAYCVWFSKKTGQKYRLPTEAEWEYAAGNGAKHTKYSWGNGDPVGKKGGSLADETGAKHYNWTKNATNIFLDYTDGYASTAPVGSFDVNDFGLHDMTGNVWEWCSDWYGSDYYKNSPAKDPTGPATGSFRVLRGGSWLFYPQICRVAYRNVISPGFRVVNVGFRLARTK